jgi:hypothetical protein
VKDIFGVGVKDIFGGKTKILFHDRMRGVLELGQRCFITGRNFFAVRAKIFSLRVKQRMVFVGWGSKIFL